MGGFFGVVSTSNCVTELYYGTDYHSHLGTRRGGMAMYSSDGSIIRRIHDISNAQFRSKFDGILHEFTGHCGIGCISDFEDQPLLVNSHLGSYAIVTVSKVANIDELAAESFRAGSSHFLGMSNGELNPTEMIASLINRKCTLTEGIEFAMDTIQGSCSLLIMTQGKIIAARDKFGRTPISIGKRNTDGTMAVTMETSAFPNLDFVHLRDLGPGEIVELSPNNLVQLKAPGELNQICSFFWVYFGYPSSNFEGINTESTRYRNGASIAADDDYSEIDTIGGIPDSGVAHAIGYSNASGKPYQRALVKYTPTWPRSFMPTMQAKRNLIAKMKLIPVRELIENQRLLLIDDSIVRGTQLRETSDFLYESGAREVHVRPACPPIMFGCKYINFSRATSDMELIARRIIAEEEGANVDRVILEDYANPDSARYAAMVEKMRDQMHFSSLRFNRLDDTVKATGLDEDQLCTYCWNGRE